LRIIKREYEEVTTAYRKELFGHCYASRGSRFGHTIEMEHIGKIDCANNMLYG